MFDKIKNGREKLKPIRTLLIDFGGECLIPLSSIELLVTIGELPHQVTKMVNFLVVEHPSMCNIILGRLALNMFRAIASTYHRMIKFFTQAEVEVLNQENFRRCYAITLKGKIDKHENLQVMLDLREEKNEQRVSPIEKLDIFQLEEREQSKITLIG